MVLDKSVRKVWVRRPTKAKLSVRRRTYGITPNNCVRVARYRRLMINIAKVLRALPCIAHFTEEEKGEKKSKLLKVFAIVVAAWKQIMRPPPELNEPLDQIKRTHVRIEHLEDADVPGLFRFDNKEQLQHLKKAFCFPERMETRSGHVFHGEEVLLAGLYRLHTPNVLGDAGWRAIFGFDQPTASRACAVFFVFMCKNWSYLLLDHMDFWLPYLPSMAEHIRAKLEQRGCYFPPGSFRIFSFIDDTMNATCRPGGGPAGPGVDAERNPKEIQRAFYNGWKKLHGMKWQTLDMPNGMNFHVWGPVSIRHNDLWTLEVSSSLPLTQCL